MRTTRILGGLGALVMAWTLGGCGMGHDGPGTAVVRSGLDRAWRGLSVAREGLRTFRAAPSPKAVQQMKDGRAMMSEGMGEMSEGMGMMDDAMMSGHCGDGMSQGMSMMQDAMEKMQEGCPMMENGDPSDDEQGAMGMQDGMALMESGLGRMESGMGCCEGMGM